MSRVCPSRTTPWLLAVLLALTGCGGDDPSDRPAQDAGPDAATIDITGDWLVLRYHFTTEAAVTPAPSALNEFRFEQEGNTFRQFFRPDDEVGLGGVIENGVYIQTDGSFTARLVFEDEDHGTGTFVEGERTNSFDLVRVGAADNDVAGEWLADDGTGTTVSVTVALEGDTLTVDIGEQGYSGRLGGDTGLLVGEPQPDDGAIAANLRWSSDEEAVATIYESSWTPDGAGHSDYTSGQTVLTLSRPGVVEGCTADSECDNTEQCIERECEARVDGSPCDNNEACPGDLYCARNLCQDGSTGNLCNGTADCVDPADLCDTTCRAREAGEECGPGDACPSALYCAASLCRAGETGDPCETTANCLGAADVCEGNPPVCTTSGDPFCGNAACDGDETWNLCPDDCLNVCGDAVCDANEQLVAPGDGAFCPGDCQVTVIFELDATSNLPDSGEGAWIVGNQTEFGDWTPNTIPLLDNGADPDLSAGDNRFTAAFVFDPGTSLEYKYTVGAMGADWAGTQEYGGGNNRGYIVPSDGIGEVRIRDVWAEQPATPAGMGSSSTVAVESAACVFDETCDRSRENEVSCPSECSGPDPCDPNPCYEGVACSEGDSGAECGPCPDGFDGDGFTCAPICIDEECPGNGTQDCLNETGQCQPKDCARSGGVAEGFCGSGECFERFCAEGVCIELCEAAYGPVLPIGGWECTSFVGWCLVRQCGGSSDCGSVSECVQFFNTDRYDGISVTDFLCISHDASPCNGSCGDGQICLQEGGGTCG